MIITFVVASAPHPIGGIIVNYELANALSRRGHRVHMLHAPFLGNRIQSMDDVAWFRFEDGIEHRNYGDGDTWTPENIGEMEATWPSADIAFGFTQLARSGLPVHVVQGLGMLSPDLEHAVHQHPGLKVCVSTWLVEEGRRRGVPDEHLALVPNGIDHSRFRVTKPQAGRHQNVAILRSGHPAKGWTVGMDALSRVNRSIPEMRAIAFGTTEPEHPIPPWMTFVRGPSPEVLVERIYNESRILLQPSHYEGFGLTAVEAMASGCALVTTDNGGSQDYAIHNETALVAEPGDSAHLARMIVSLLADDSKRTQLAHAGTRLVRRFDWDESGRLLEGYLERYLADPVRFGGTAAAITPIASQPS